MKKLLAGIAVLSVWITSPGIANAQQYTKFEHQNDRYYSQTLNPQGVAYFQYQVPAHTFGVFTLKNRSSRSDFDIYVYDSSGNLLVKGERSGVQTELVTTPSFSSNDYAYIQIVNYGSQASEYQFYANYVSPFNRFLIALAETSLICRGEAEGTRNQASSRVVTGISSILQGNDLAGVSKDLLVNELLSAIRNQFGYGCMGDFVANWGASTFMGVLRNYP